VKNLCQFYPLLIKFVGSNVDNLSGFAEEVRTELLHMNITRLEIVD
jgi:hypothetical protein